MHTKRRWYQLRGHPDRRHCGSEAQMLRRPRSKIDICRPRNKSNDSEGGSAENACGRLCGRPVKENQYWRTTNSDQQQTKGKRQAIPRSPQTQVRTIHDRPFVATYKVATAVWPRGRRGKVGRV